MTGNAISLFSAEELELLVHGSAEALDVAALQLRTRYEGGFSKTHPTMYVEL